MTSRAASVKRADTGRDTKGPGMFPQGPGVEHVPAVVADGSGVGLFLRQVADDGQFEHLPLKRLEQKNDPNDQTA